MHFKIESLKPLEQRAERACNEARTLVRETKEIMTKAITRHDERRARFEAREDQRQAAFFDRLKHQLGEGERASSSGMTTIHNIPSK